MNASFLLTAFLLSMLSLQAQGTFEKHEYVASNGLLLPYQMLEPVKDQKHYPLVIFLHGAGERGGDNEAQMTHGSSWFTSTDALQNYPSYVIFPQCRAGSYWASADVDRSSYPVDLSFDYKQKSTTADLQAVMDLIQEMTASFPIDDRRIYVMGLSMGGMGTFEIVHRMPRTFAAAIPICGGGDSGGYTRLARKVPFWIFHGDADTVVDVTESRDMVDALRKKKFKAIKYTEYPGVGHNSWDNAFAEPDLYYWMYDQER
ncbi:MAG: prolyl oligopeptidase family serine peptidase [Bacteroidota bacterium]